VLATCWQTESRLSAAHLLYTSATWLLTPLAPFILKRRLGQGKEDPVRLPERMGITRTSRPKGHLVWLHAASVGEAVSLLTLVDRFRQSRPDLRLLITTGTLTSAHLMAKRLPADVIHQFIPLDSPAYIARFLDHWQPDVGLIVESELWPNLILMAAKRGVKMGLINARFSQSSYEGWGKASGFLKSILTSFELILAQDSDSKLRLEARGARAVHSAGNLKFDAPPPTAAPEQLEALRQAVAGRPLWLAASTHPGEEDIISQAHILLKKTFPDLLTVLVPRHPERGVNIGDMLDAQGLRVATRTVSYLPPEVCDIMMVDTLGELGLFYALCPIVFVGGSLVPIGGHNLLEAARLNCALLTGSHTDNFKEVIETFKAAQAIDIVENAEELAARIALFLKDEAQRTTQADRALQAAQDLAGVTDKVWAHITPLLPPPRAALTPVNLGDPN
jgi:3-deoxy-D-manno-octulosonic-acid transferase